MEAPRKTAPKSSPAKKKIKEFLVTYGMQLLMVALFLVIPLTLLLCLATDTVQSDNTWLDTKAPPDLPNISCYIHQCVSAFLNWSNVLQSVVLHVYIFVSQE